MHGYLHTHANIHVSINVYVCMSVCISTLSYKDEKEKSTSVNITSSDNQTKSGLVSGSKTKQQSSRKSPRINADEETSGYFRESQSQR